MHASCLNYTCNHVSLRIYELPLKRIDCWHKQQTNRVLIVFHGVGQSASQAAAFRHAHKVIDWEMTLVACWPRKPPATRGSRNPIGRRFLCTQKTIMEAERGTTWIL